MAESLAQKQARFGAILEGLEQTYPAARIELDYRTPLELLVAVVLSAQCTDKRVNLVTPALFRRFRSAADYAAVQPEDLHPFIQSCGLYRNKAKAIVALARELVASHVIARPHPDLLAGYGAATGAAL